MEISAVSAMKGKKVENFIVPTVNGFCLLAAIKPVCTVFHINYFNS